MIHLVSILYDDVQWNPLNTNTLNMKVGNGPFNVPSIPICSDNMNTFQQSLEFRVKWVQLYVRMYAHIQHA